MRRSHKLNYRSERKIIQKIHLKKNENLRPYCLGKYTESDSVLLFVRKWPGIKIASRLPLLLAREIHLFIYIPGCIYI